MKTQVQIELPESKSISNRLLILQKLYGDKLRVEGLSTADDSKILESALHSSDKIINVGMAGTAYRFLTAYLAIAEGEKILTGAERMCSRPIAPLVDALRSMKAEITYLEKNGFPPLKISGKKLKGGEVRIDANISSQFISALMLIAPKLPKGLQLHLSKEVVSEPYIDMTADILKQCGVKLTSSSNSIEIQPMPQISAIIQVEKDWSSAAFFYNLLCCMPAPELSIHFPKLHLKSMQGDSALPEIYAHLGVNTVETDIGLTICRDGSGSDKKVFDFSDTPDLLQPFLVSCAALNREVLITGVETLRIKETDRILAMQKELAKLGCSFVFRESGLYQFIPTEKWPAELYVNTYNDHRMAMAFAALFKKIPKIQIEKPEVVSKSFPGFWQEMQKVGFPIRALSE